MPTTEERFFDKVALVPETPCWIWTGAQGNGYGRFSLTNPRRMVQAHHWSYEFHVGPIPDGLTLDHVKARGCTSTLCVNPAHLEPVTAVENFQRWAASITHCPHGHEYTEANTYVSPRNQRHCRECWRIRSIGRKR